MKEYSTKQKSIRKAKTPAQSYLDYSARGLIPKNQERSLKISTGLTFGTISALYGFSHDIVSPEQYSFLVAVVIASAVVPTLIAGIFFLPRHLLPKTVEQVAETPDENGLGEEG